MEKLLIIKRNDAVVMTEETFNAIMKQFQFARNELQSKASKLQEINKPGNMDEFNSLNEIDNFKERISIEEVKNGKPETLEQIFIEMAELGL